MRTLADYNLSIINPFALTILILMSLMIIFVKKEYMVIPLIFISCFITSMQRIVILGIDFPYIRILVIAGFLRLFLRDERSPMQFNTIDKIMIYWMSIRFILYSILWSSAPYIISRLGETVDIMGVYFLIRLIINDSRGYDVIIKTIILASIPMAIFMIIEQLSGGRNFFSIFGGVREFNLLRGGKLRAQGAFSHPIMAGTFGATIFPLAWSMWYRNKKNLALLGLVTSFVITYTSSSSGPIVTFSLCIFGVLFWSLRQYTKIVRNSFFVLLLLLQLVMNAPIWHLISRVDIVGGSTGYHRYLLMEAAFQHMTDWLLIGTRSTEVWGILDITNQYILEGIRGGIIPLILFIVIISKGFQSVGEARSRLEKHEDLQKIAWAFGTIWFAHTVTFVSVSYFGQMTFFYYLLLAMISSLNTLPEIKNADT